MNHRRVVNGITRQTTALASLAIVGSMLFVNAAKAQQAFNGQQGAVQGQRVAAPNQQAAAANQQVAPKTPFEPLNPQQQARLDQLLLAWQQQSQATKTLECDFERWEFDLNAAPAGVHAKKGKGVIKYGNPDKGLFRVDELLVFKGMKDNKPQYGADPSAHGGYWVCTGEEVHSYDRSEKKCTILELPQNMQGTQIFNSPLPFVFNLDAQQIKQRYWVRSIDSPKPNTYLIEAWPKTQQDRAQYRMVQIVLNQQFDPEALIMYAPNFNAKFAPEWDHYEFKNVKRNAVGAGVQSFFGNFIPQRIPMGWKVEREKMGQDQVAQQPGGQGSVPR